MLLWVIGLLELELGLEWNTFFSVALVSFVGAVSMSDTVASHDLLLWAIDTSSILLRIS